MNEPGSNVAQVYAEVRVALLAFLRKHTGDAQVAEDLLHDVVVKALVASRDEAHVPQNLTGWLYAVARNAAMDTDARPCGCPPTSAALEAPSSCHLCGLGASLRSGTCAAHHTTRSHSMTTKPSNSSEPALRLYHHPISTTSRPIMMFQPSRPSTRTRPYRCSSTAASG